VSECLRERDVVSLEGGREAVDEEGLVEGVHGGEPGAQGAQETPLSRLCDSCRAGERKAEK